MDGKKALNFIRQNHTAIDILWYNLHYLERIQPQSS